MGAFQAVKLALLSAGILAMTATAGSAADGVSNTFTSAGLREELAQARDSIEHADYWAAIARLNNIITADPRIADAYNLLGFSYRKTGKFDLAERNYKRALRLDPTHRAALEYVGELYLETGRRDQAAAALAWLEKLCPEGCEELSDLRQVFNGR